MTTYAWPARAPFIPEKLTWGVKTNSRAAVSPLSGYTQTTVLPGNRWTVGMDFPAHTWAQRAELEAFLLRLDGMTHRVSLWDISRTKPATLSGSPLVNGALAQFATTVNIDGAISGGVAPGDWLSLPLTAGGSQLVQVMNTVTGASLTGVEFRPMLRGAVSDNAAIGIASPTALFVLQQPDLQFPRAGAAIAPPFSVEFIEVFA
jgi:hypothetical protein